MFRASLRSTALEAIALVFDNNRRGEQRQAGLAQHAFGGRAAQRIEQALAAGGWHCDQLRAAPLRDRDDRVDDVALPQHDRKIKARACFVAQLGRSVSDMQKVDLRGRRDNAQGGLDLAERVYRIGFIVDGNEYRANVDLSGLEIDKAHCIARNEQSQRACVARDIFCDAAAQPASKAVARMCPQNRQIALAHMRNLLHASLEGSSNMEDVELRFVVDRKAQDMLEDDAARRTDIRRVQNAGTLEILSLRRPDKAE